MSSESRIYKAYWVLRNFSPGELQSYALVTKPHKVGRGRDSIIEERDFFIPATGIPASTIKKFQDNIYTPRETSIKKLSDFYHRYQRQKLRSVGMNREDARRYSRKYPDKINEYIRDYNKWAQNISDNYTKSGKDVPILFIRWGMAHSWHRMSEWEHISMTSGLIKK